MPRPAHTHHAVLHVEYDGGGFHGWARQPGALPTIEQALLDACAGIGCDDVQLRCAGRTDAGVHASGQIVDVRYSGAIEPDGLVRALVTTLPGAISVRSSRAAQPGFDARGDATSRAYDYRILPGTAPSALRRAYVLHHPRPLDRALLDEAALAVLGTHHFRPFTPGRTEHEFFDRTVVESAWTEDGDELVYRIRANAFLRQMVRRIVGSMLAVARGQLDPVAFRHMLDGAAGHEVVTTAPPHGLCLVDVTFEPVDGLPLPPRWRSGRGG